MCNFNIACLVNDGSCKCTQPKGFLELIKPIPVPLSSTNDSSYFNLLLRMLMQQNELIKSVSEQTNQILSKLSQNRVNEEVTTASQFQRLIYGQKADYPFSLQVLTEIPNPAYKERAFSLMLQIINEKNEKVFLSQSVSFEVLLFSAENPPKVIKFNTAGDKIFKGMTGAQGNSSVLFRKIAVKEVTSHFRNGCFFFVVAAKDCSEIRPLVVENFVVKARKMNCEGEIRKKMKIELNLTEGVRSLNKLDV